jgi:hypothetical protein
MPVSVAETKNIIRNREADDEISREPAEGKQ